MREREGMRKDRQAARLDFTWRLDWTRQEGGKREARGRQCLLRPSVQEFRGRRISGMGYRHVEDWVQEFRNRCIDTLTLKQGRIINFSAGLAAAAARCSSAGNFVKLINFFQFEALRRLRTTLSNSSTFSNLKAMRWCVYINALSLFFYRCSSAVNFVKLINFFQFEGPALVYIHHGLIAVLPVLRQGILSSSSTFSSLKQASN